MAAVIRPAQHDLRIAALAADKPYARRNFKLKRMVRGPFKIILPRSKRSPRPEPFLGHVVIFKNIQVKRVKFAVLKIANNCLAAKKHLAVRTVTRKLAIFPTRAFVPHLGRYIVAPRFIGGRERQHIEAVPLLLVCVGNRVGNIAVLLNLSLYRMGRNA